MSATETLIETLEDSPEWNEKFSRQIKLETSMRDEGVDRYWSTVSRNREAGKETRTQSTGRLFNVALKSLINAINEFKEQATSGKAGPKHSALKYISKLETEVVALITTRCVLDRITQETNITTAARRIARGIQDELSYRHFAKEDSITHSHLVKRLKTSSSERHIRNVMRMNMHSRHIQTEDWLVDVQVKVGSKLIDLLVESTGIIQVVTLRKSAHKTEVVVQASDNLMSWLQEENSRLALLSPVYLPTIIPPKPWTTPFDGGYWTNKIRGVRLINSRMVTKAYLDELAEQNIDKVYDAVNVVQNTEWCINTKVLDVIRNLWESNSELGGIPSAEEVPLPPKPAFLEEKLDRELWTEQQVAEFKEWKRSASDIHVYNAKLKSLRLRFMKILHIAESFKDEETIFFPHQMDFRGRLYPVPLFLNPQGSDEAKGLLTFANTVPVSDKEDADWLAIHGANVYGYDKASLEERVQWVEEHEQEITAVSEDPYNNKFWSRADKPFQFLAFCFEWAAFKANGYGFQSSLAVQMDGSCNGLQHFSAMLRDKTGAEAVNLLPSDKPNDVYRIVAEYVLPEVTKDSESEDEQVAKIAKGWLKTGIDRKVCKRPVMTLTYGATKAGFTEQIYTDTVVPSKMKDRHNFPWEGSGYGAASYLGNIIWNCTGHVVVAAREAMDWLQAAAKEAAKEELPVRWYTPDGFPVCQHYPKYHSKRIDLTFDSRRIKLSVVTPEVRKVDKVKQTSSIAPNWVHSLDAAHMRATVRACSQAGMKSFSLIHDSFGTHAGNAWKLAEVLREEFISMYSDDLLQKFKDELEGQLKEGKKLPDIPNKGELDIREVNKSKYFFA